jgi:hypothetical protein
MSPRKKNSDGQKRKTVSFRLPNHLVALVRALAVQNRRTLSGEVHVALERHLTAHGYKTPTPPK